MSDLVFQIKINCENDAFATDTLGEVRRLVDDALARVELSPNYEMYQTLLDVNGNNVGWFRFGRRGDR